MNKTTTGVDSGDDSAVRCTSADEVIAELREILSDGALIEEEEASKRHSDLASGSFCRARVIVRPSSTEEVAAVMRTCHKHRQRIVPLGGVTGMVGGCITQPGDIGLSLERLNQIEEIDTQNNTITVQAGVPLQAVQEAVSEKDLLFPLDLGARGSATIGGNIATNAGGNSVLRFGMIRQMILGLEVVLADGTVLTSMKKVLKNNTGYDLKQLFIGSEGTLGVVTRTVLRLRPAPKSRETALLAVNDFASVISLLHRSEGALGSDLSSFEVMWQSFFRQVFDYSDKHKPPFAEQYPYYVLVELLGSDPASDARRFERTLEEFLQSGLIADAVLAKSTAERNALWEIRDDVEALIAHYPIFIYDVSVSIDQMEGYVSDVRSRLERGWPDFKCFVFGHVGDGNLHLVIAVGSNEKVVRDKVEDIVYGELRGRNGVISAEHGIGLDKKSHLSVSRTPEEIEVMKILKKALDPENILNPGKVISV